MNKKDKNHDLVRKSRKIVLFHFVDETLRLKEGL